MKNVSAFLKRHSALLLLVLVLATVPAGIAFGKYVKSVNVTSGISVDVQLELAPKTYTIDKTKMQTALKSLTTKPSSLEFVTGNEVPKGATLCTADGIQDESSSGFGKIGVYLSADKTAAYIAPMDKNDIKMYAPQDCSRFLDNLNTSLGKSLKSIRCSSLNTSNVTNMEFMFNNCSSLTELNVRSFDTSNVTTMRYMFGGCSRLSALDVSVLDTSKVTNMAYMFYKCSGLKSLDLSSFNTSEVTSMGNMFNNCSGLTELNLSMFDTAMVKTMQSMFHNCSKLNALDLSMLDTSNVTKMANMFQNCSGLTSLNVKFNTSNVTSMDAMFRGCSNLTLIDVSSFDTSGVTQMQHMFQECSSLTTINASDKFNTDKVTSSSDMFTGCENLVGEAGTRYSEEEVTDVSYARIDGGKSNPGYFTGDLTTLSANGSIYTRGFGIVG